MVLFMQILLFMQIALFDAFLKDPDTCQCGWHNTRRIVGGMETGINEYPMMAGLVALDYTEFVFAGGTIISINYILTAANSVRNQELENTGVLVGDWDTYRETDTDTSKLYHAAKFIIHKDFSSKKLTNDIALIRTTEPIIFSLEVGPACLPFLYQRMNLQDSYVKLLGWGTIDYGSTISETLLETEVRVISFKECSKVYPNVRNKQFCTYTERKDACQGDSGGPALWQKNAISHVQLVGIINSGYGCGLKNNPGLITKVAAFIGWIRNNTPGEIYCIKD